MVYLEPYSDIWLYSHERIHRASDTDSLDSVQSTGDIWSPEWIHTAPYLQYQGCYRAQGNIRPDDMVQKTLCLIIVRCKLKIS